MIPAIFPLLYLLFIRLGTLSERPHPILPLIGEGKSKISGKRGLPSKESPLFPNAVKLDGIAFQQTNSKRSHPFLHSVFRFPTRP